MEKSLRTLTAHGTNVHAHWMRLQYVAELNVRNPQIIKLIQRSEKVLLDVLIWLALSKAPEWSPVLNSIQNAPKYCGSKTPHAKFILLKDVSSQRSFKQNVRTKVNTWCPKPKWPILGSQSKAACEAYNYSSAFVREVY